MRQGRSTPARAGLLLALTVCLLPGTSPNGDGVLDARRQGAAGHESGPGVRSTSPHPFVEITTETGLDFVHLNGARGDLLLPEVIGSGGALFDYDNDGDLDLFAVQSGVLGSGDRPASDAPRSRLYRNDPGPDRLPRFTDVTNASGIDVAGYGMGVAAGDIDNDGWTDLYVTALGPNRLLRNNGNGTFSDVTAESGTNDPRWSTSATFFDFDGDGWLDLFVTGYVHFRPELQRACFSAGSARDYCNPVVYEPVADTLFRNNRNGTFTNVTVRAGLGGAPARGLGVIAADVDGDGRVDLYVANDGDPNQLWLNAGDGSFRDHALLAGVAVNRSGLAQGSMGIDVGDVDGDGQEDLFVTNLDNEGNILYRHVGKGLFDDRTVETGLLKLGFTGFGTRFVDFDHDGWLDLVVVNGAVRHLPRQVRQGDPYPLRQRNQLFRNAGGRFTDVTDTAGPAFGPLHVARGLAAGDLDNDGDVDLVIFNNSGPVRVLRNTADGARHWLGLRVLDRRWPRDALQARVVLIGSGRPPDTVRRVQTDGSYLSAGDPRTVFGLGGDDAPQAVRVVWADGVMEEFRGLTVNRYWLLEAGKPPRSQ